MGLCRRTYGYLTDLPPSNQSILPYLFLLRSGSLYTRNMYVFNFTQKVVYYKILNSTWRVYDIRLLVIRSPQETSSYYIKGLFSSVGEFNHVVNFICTRPREAMSQVRLCVYGKSYVIRLLTSYAEKRPSP